MCDDVSYDHGQETKRNKSPGKHLRKRVEQSEIGDERSQKNGVTKLHDDNKSQSCEDIPQFHGKELFELQRAGRKERGRETTDNANLPVQQKPRLGNFFDANSDDNVIKYDEDTEKSDVLQSPGTLSFPAGRTNGTSRHFGTTNTTENTRYSQIYGKFTNQRKKERKLSRRNLTVLPPLAEEKYDRSPQTSPSITPVTRRHTIGDFRERKGFEVPRIVFTTPDEDAGVKTLKLPKIEVANTKSRYLQVPLSLPEPNRLAPPIFVEPYKAHRPPAQPRSEDNNSVLDALRLPQLRTSSSTISTSDENEKGVKKTPRLCWIVPDESHGK